VTDMEHYLDLPHKRQKHIVAVWDFPIKNVCSQGGLSNADKEGDFQIRTSAFSGAKTLIFQNLRMSARTRGVKPVRTFFGQGRRGVNFSRFCV